MDFVFTLDEAMKAHERMESSLHIGKIVLQIAYTDRNPPAGLDGFRPGGELEQIQFLLGHVSIETTERYLGCKQRFQNAVNDGIGLDSSGS